MLFGKSILLIVTAGIAAYKCPELVRRLRELGATVRCVMTDGAKEFVTPLTLSAVSEDKVYEDLFSLTDEQEMGHIQLSRDADVLLVAPASANTLAKMAGGQADNLAATVLLATDKPVLVAPAMNVRMWEHKATQANLKTITSRGVDLIGPVEGEMACGEYGMGRMSEPADIAAAVDSFFNTVKPLTGKRAIVTSGPTLEPIDPVRFISNRSSGKQGHAIAEALASFGADVTLVSGPTKLPDPFGVTMVYIESARDMLSACKELLCTDGRPADVAVCVAAVSDWYVADPSEEKLKKTCGEAPFPMTLRENPDILAALSALEENRPALVIGFAAETENIVGNAQAKLLRKGCDWIIANDVSPETKTFGGDDNTVHLITPAGANQWPAMSKSAVAKKLTTCIASALTSELKA